MYNFLNNKLNTLTLIFYFFCEGNKVNYLGKYLDL